MFGSLLKAGLGLAGAFGGKKSKYNPGYAQADVLNNTPNIIKPYYNPFITEGADINQRLRPEYERMAYQPNDWLHNIESQYEESPGYKYKRNKLLKGAHNTAAAHGFAGTDEDIRGRSELMNGILSEDMQKYLENIGSIHGKGLTGLESRVERGYGASNNLANLLAQIDMAKAGAMGQGAAHAGQAQGNVFSALSGLVNAGFGNGRGGRGGGGGGGWGSGGGGIFGGMF